ncbi:hypothetical protein E4H12_03505 [Candidatus Thorarchaeota archaeon]|nr:MAG: hypothetical protein E4H12_03505 [Candidatus Thorarchaeota archaeon]
MQYATALIRFILQKKRIVMLQFDFGFLILWYVIPFALLGLRAAFAAYKAYRKRQEMRLLEERITPFTSDF